ncbi:hypothetical protein QPK87_11560 [Kamptonema cortianum]|nr:hypothetical protein [Kamptonema cortianum]
MNRLKTFEKQDLTECAFDGAAFHGPRGTAMSCLSGKSRIITESRMHPECWIIPLDEMELVRQAAELGGERLWLSPCPPEKFLGRLADGFQGAWFDNDTIHVRIGGRKTIHPAQEPDSRDETLAMLVFAAGMTWKECSEEEIQRILGRFKPALSAQTIEEMSLL